MYPPTSFVPSLCQFSQLIRPDQWSICPPSGKMLLAFVLFLGLGLAPPTLAQDNPDRIGIHVTQGELDVWRTRADEGPYKDWQDAGYETPDDWNQIKGNAESFLSNPSAERFVVDYDGSDCLPRGYHEPTLSLGQKMRDAAFYSLVRDDDTYRDAVLQELLWQANEPTTDFGDRSYWCTDPSESLGGDYAFTYAEWMTRLLFAYDYIRPYISQGDRETLDQWFTDAGKYFQENVDRQLAELFDDREAGVLSGYGQAIDDPDPDELTHHGGWEIASFNKWWNNRRSAQMRFVTFAGIQQDNATLVESGKQWVKDVLKYGIFPDGVPVEYHRSHGYKASKGWSYAGVTISHMVEIANHLARDGDEELMNYSTSEGVAASAGGEKTIRLVVDHMLGTMDGSIKIYNQTGTEGDSDDLLDGFVASENRFYAYDMWLAQINNYWGDASVRDKYLTIGPEHRNLESRDAGVKNTGPFMPWGGSGDVYPGMMFMFADMEDQTDPYPSDGTTQTIPLSKGWNTVGSSVAPTTADLDVVLEDIESNLVLMKDEEGKVYYPDKGIDELGSWDTDEGYVMYVEEADTLVMEGQKIDLASTEIQLEQGWNIVPYVPSSPQSVSETVQSIASSLFMVKDEQGRTYIPEFGIDDIGELNPDHAYKIFVESDAVLTFP